MMRAIRELGEYEIQRKNLSLENPIPILAENPDSNGKYNHVFAVVFKKIGEDWKYQDVLWEPLDKSTPLKYLYKKGAPAGTDVTTTVRFNDFEKSFIKRSLKCLENAKENESLSQEDRDFFENLSEEIVKNLDEIKETIERFRSEVPSGEYSIVTTKFIENGANFYNKDVSVFKKLLKRKGQKAFSYKYKKTSLKNNSRCSICNKTQEEVYGFVNTFNFYSADKPGYLASGFRQENAWKNYPVCLECALLLQSGRDYLEENLRFNFYGMSYLLIPKFIYKKDLDSVLQVMTQWKDPSFKQDASTLFTSDEKEVLHHISQLKDNISVNFLFYNESQSAYKILLLIEDILPSRFTTLFQIKNDIEQLKVFREYKSGKGNKGLKFNFGVVNHFFPVRTSSGYNKDFIEIVDKVFQGNNLNYSYLLHHLMHQIRSEFANQEGTLRWTVVSGFLFIRYLQELGILTSDIKGEPMENAQTTHSESLEGKLKNFIREHSTFFTYPEQKAVFLMGVLTKFLMNIQYAQRKSTPFLSKLGNLRLDQRSIQRLLTDIKGKMLEYDASYYRRLEAEIAEYFIQAGNKWQINNDEINFNFVLGMQLADQFKTQGENND